MDELELKLCDIQGRLFELSADKGYTSAAFVKAFMTSETAKELDSKYNRMQWAGEEYILEEVASAAGEELTQMVKFTPKMCFIGLVIFIAIGTSTTAKIAQKSINKPRLKLRTVIT